MKKSKKELYKKIMRIFISCAIFTIIIITSINELKETNLKQDTNEEYNTQILSIQNIYNNFENTIYNTNKSLSEQIITEYNGYKVIAKLEIPKINLETYVLEEYSITALGVSVTKFWGANPNEIGNFCIAGHNFKNKNMFHDLKNLKVQDKLFISDNKNGKKEYEIYDLYKVYPENVSCLSQETQGNKEVTLITCTNDSKKRIIVKAREIK